MKQTVTEALAVVLVGAAIALGANALNEQGLEWGRDYFPISAQAAAGGLGAARTAPSPFADEGPVDGGAETPDRGEPDVARGEPQTAAADPTAGALGVDPGDERPSDDGHDDDAIVARLAAKGLRAISHDDFVALMDDPMMAAGAYLVLDARRAEDFAEGHIPGAVPFDPFYPDRYLPDLLPLLPGAQRIVVYCNGGVCDDSESAALILASFVSSPDLLEIYVGGMSAWRAAGLPTEPR